MLDKKWMYMETSMRTRHQTNCSFLLFILSYSNIYEGNLYLYIVMLRT